MSDTPETDNLARGNHVVPTEFAQDLERERDETQKELADLNKRFIDKCVKEARLQMQLDERWALRRELEAELGITDEMASDESLMVGLEAIKALKRERDEEGAITFRQADCIDELESERDDALAMVKRLLYVAYLGSDSQEKYSTLDEAQKFIKDK